MKTAKFYRRLIGLIVFLGVTFCWLFSQVIAAPAIPPAAAHSHANALYANAEGSWALRQSMPTSRYDPGVAAASNGKIYVVGGSNATGELTLVEEYDPTTNSWQTRAPMLSARHNLGAIAAPNGKIYAIGGVLSDSTTMVGTVEEYDPVEDSWRTRRTMPTPRDCFGIAIGADGMIYVIGGEGGLAVVESYDPATDTWQARANLPTPRWGLGAVAALNGRIYAIGGLADGPTNIVEEYNPLTNVWDSVASMPSPRYMLATALASDGQVYAMGGSSVAYTSGIIGVLNVVEAYDPDTNTWQTRAAMPVSKFIFSAAAAQNGKIYTFGGVSNGVLVNTVEEFTPSDSAQPTVTPTPEGTTTPAVTLTPIPTVPIPAVTLSLEVESGFDRMQLKWDPSTNAEISMYRIYRATPDDSEPFIKIAETIDTQYFDMTELVKQQNYCYQAVAMSGSSEVEKSNIACAQFGELDVWVPDTYAIQNDTIIVPVNIRNATGLNVVSSDIWLDFDPAVLQCKGVTNTAMTVDFVWMTNINNTIGRVKISTITNPKTLYGDGSLFWLTFNVLGVAGASSSLTIVPFTAGLGGSSLQSQDTGSGWPVSVKLSLTGGHLFVETTGKLGDVDDNSVVTAGDAFLALEMSVDKIIPTNKQKYAADVNGDGVVSAADVTMILYYAVNQAWPLPPTQAFDRLQRAGSAVTILSLDSVSGSPGSIMTTTLRAKDLNKLSGGDWVISYDPKVIAQIVSITPVGSAASAALSWKDDHTGLLKISMAANMPISGDTALATIKVRLVPATTTNATGFTLAGAKLNDLYGRDFVLSAIQGSIQRENAVIKTGYRILLPYVNK